ncbi:hypothetical protein G7Z99_09730 [Pseudomonas entomophila]|uniref:hypothetical protein n=1 Tax=Pseudomonas entomophila TaxID=312306 RepID=UPI0015E398D3|nr:hypothetical protein [Pseudomonas entomophila]MBA1189328.1 hypothetical protein [Pseudomonas entomophila]
MYSAKTVFIASMLLALAGCENKKVESCPQAGRDFLEKSIRAHFDKSYPKFGGSAVQILSDEKYEKAPNVWMVSVNAPDKGYTALVSCTGQVELSGNQLGPSTPPRS